MQHEDLPKEQAYIDRAYERLEAMRDSVRRQRDEALREVPITDQAMLHRDMTVYRTQARLDQLEIADQSLVFGRMDTAGESFYIGRLAVADEDFTPLVVDWRAPIAEAFYRATGSEPLGLTRRRHFLCEGRNLVGIQDELFGKDGLGVAGTEVLRSALERARTGHMRDIVSTIQREQDEVIRAELEGVLVVQGGPGTGKTAVALHRAAYLLFTHRRRLERQGILVIGPNQVFLRYIDQVLPALGESGVALSTLTDLVDGVRFTAKDDPATELVKGDARMAKVVRNAVRDRQRPLPRDLELSFDEDVIVLTAQQSSDVVHAAKRRRGTHNARRRWVLHQVYRRLYSSYREIERRAGSDAEPVGYKDFVHDLRADPALRRAMDRMWPLLTPSELLEELFATPPLLHLATRNVLSPAERDRLARPFDSPWTDADAPLLDEALAQLGPRRQTAVEDPDEEAPVVPDYGHIVVDEAQELSPMQLRMVARRSLTGSMTLVGDVDQASGIWAPRTWDDVLAHLPTERGLRIAALTVNYRTPRELMEFAGRVLAHGCPPQSARESGEPPVVLRVDDLCSAAASCAAAELEKVHPGMVAVIAAVSMIRDVAKSMDASGPEFSVTSESQKLETPVALLDAETAKGLEFDSVIVVEPALVASEAVHPEGALYVALTRATRRLTLLHRENLPPALG